MVVCSVSCGKIDLVAPAVIPMTKHTLQLSLLLGQVNGVVQIDESSGILVNEHDIGLMKHVDGWSTLSDSQKVAIWVMYRISTLCLSGLPACPAMERTRRPSRSWYDTCGKYPGSFTFLLR